MHNQKLQVPVADIMRIEALSNYSRIYFADGKIMVVAKVLGLLRELLPAAMFVRVHQSHLVNKLFVKTLSGNNSKKLLMNNGEYIVVSRRKQVTIKKRLNAAHTHNLLVYNINY